MDEKIRAGEPYIIVPRELHESFGTIRAYLEDYFQNWKEPTDIELQSFELQTNMRLSHPEVLNPIMVLPTRKKIGHFYEEDGGARSIWVRP